jgi:hypothetical protein
MMDSVSDLFDLVSLCAGLLLIAWLGWRESARRKTRGDRSLQIGMFVWLVGFGFALYLIFG